MRLTELAGDSLAVFVGEARCNGKKHTINELKAIQNEYSCLLLLVACVFDTVEHKPSQKEKILLKLLFY